MKWFFDGHYPTTGNERVFAADELHFYGTRLIYPRRDNDTLMNRRGTWRDGGREMARNERKEEGTLMYRAAAKKYRRVNEPLEKYRRRFGKKISIGTPPAKISAR